MRRFDTLNAKYKFKVNDKAQECFAPVNQYVFPIHQADILPEDDRCIWTVIETHPGYYLVPGYKRVNRAGYLISEEPVTQEVKALRLNSNQFSWGYV